MRLGFAAVLLLLLWRPRLPTDRRTLGLVVAFGGAIAGMNAFVYQAMARMPLGVVVTLAFLGPLAIAIAASRRLLDLLWTVLTGAGVFLLIDANGGPIAPIGVIFAVATGACWAAYILLNTAVGVRASGGQGLAWATTLAAVLVVPFSAFHARDALVSPLVLLGGLAVALLSPVISYSLDLEAL
ncbi:MAG: EamA family transporter [Nocardioidaceae bacterium]